MSASEYQATPPGTLDLTTIPVKWPGNLPIGLQVDLSGFGVYNVKFYGAKGDGVTDDTAAFNNAIAAITTNGGGVLFLPRGTFLISSTLVGFANLTGVFVRGLGTDVSVIKQSTPGAGVFTFTSCTGYGVMDLALTYATPATAGAGACFVANGSTYGFFERLLLGNPYSCFSFTACLTMWLVNIAASQRSSQGDGILFTANATPTPCTEAHITDCVFGTQGGGTGVGLHLSAINGINVSNCDFMNWGVGCQIDPAGTGIAATNVFNVFMHNAQFDGCGGFGLYINPSATGKVYHVKLVNSWTCGAGQTGVNFGGTASTVIDNISFVNHLASNCGTYGMALQNCTRVVIADSMICSNETSGSGPAGIIVTATALNTRITGNTIGNDAVFTATQTIGITIVAPGSNLLISGNDLTGNTSAAINFSGGNPGATTRIEGNLGYNPVKGMGNPTVGASPWTYTNTTGVAQKLYFTGGTITAFAVDGVAVSVSSPFWVRLTPGETVTVTYSVAPSIQATLGE